MNDYGEGRMYWFSSLRVEKSALSGIAGAVIYLFLLFFTSQGFCDEYLEIGREAYLNRVVSLSKSMAGQIKRYEKETEIHNKEMLESDK